MLNRVFYCVQASGHIQFSNSDSVNDGIALKKLCYKLYDSAYLHYNRLYIAQLGTQEKATEAYDIVAIKFRGTSAVTNFDISRYDLPDLKKLLDIDFENVKASSSSNPQNHPLVHQFRVKIVNRGNIEEISQADMFLFIHKHKNGELDEESMRILFEYKQQISQNLENSENLEAQNEIFSHVIGHNKAGHVSLYERGATASD
ncbi:hypothetical protein QUC31_014718 [Theobroma cacao]